VAGSLSFAHTAKRGLAAGADSNREAANGDTPLIGEPTVTAAEEVGLNSNQPMVPPVSEFVHVGWPFTRPAKYWVPSPLANELAGTICR
jgi:hypothetical protein